MQVQDAAQRYFMSYLGTDRLSLPDLEILFLEANGVTNGSIDERWRQYAETFDIPEPYKYNSFLTRDYVVANSLGFSAEAQALFERMDVQPTVERKVLYNVFINSLKSSGVWSKLDCMYLMAAHDAQSARLNLIKDAHNLTAVSSPTFTVDRGYTTGGSSYLNTNFTPSTQGVTYTTNSAHLGVWTAGNNVTNNQVAAGARDTAATTDLYMILRSNTLTDQVLGRMNQQAGSQAFTGTVSDSRGDTHLQRVDATNNVVFKNGATKMAQTSGTSATSNRPAFAIAIGGLNTNGTVGSIYTARFAAANIGGTLSDAEVLALYNAKLTYLQSVGAV